MKTLLTIFTLVFTVMFSSTSFAGWTKVTVSLKGNTFYVDFRRIKKDRGYVYWWEMQNLLKPDKDGDLSYSGYHQGDCKLFRVKYLKFFFYKESMGNGLGRTNTPKNPKWHYPRPNSSGKTILKSVCSR
jgi:hypothetical protein